MWEEVADDDGSKHLQMERHLEVILLLLKGPIKVKQHNISLNKLLTCSGFLENI